MSDKKDARRTKRQALTPSRCEIPKCTYTKFFQRHRIVPGRDGGKYKGGNVIALCPNCHAEADAGLLDPNYLLEIVRIRTERNATRSENINQATSVGVSDPKGFGHCSTEEPVEGNGERSADAGDGEQTGFSL
jgi:HNH endonuclease